MIVLLDDYTTGKVEAALIGEVASVYFHDENGLRKVKSGVVIEVLED